MNNDLISRSALIYRLEGILRMAENEPIQTYANAIRLAIGETKLAPAVDTEPVRRGEWTEPYKNDIWDFYKCTSCGYAQDRTSRYCPECGARMDGELEHE